MRIGFDPDRLSLDLNINGPADPYVLDRVTLQAAFGPGHLPPYGEVLRGVFEGDPTLSVRGDTAVECWRIVEPVLEAWRDDEVPLQEYPAGSAVSDDWPVGCQKSVGCHAARSYSWMRPPRTSWRWSCGAAADGSACSQHSGGSGADKPRLRWGRWRL